MTVQTPLYVGPAKAMEIIGVSRSTLYRWIKQGHIRLHKRGAASFVRVSEISAYIEGQGTPPSAGGSA